MKAYHANGHLFYYCPGCKCGHNVPVDGSGQPGRNWTWNGDLEAPTLKPSVRHHMAGRDGRGDHTRCHYNIDRGVFTFHADSGHHSLRGAHPLPDFPSGYGIGDFIVP